MHTLQAIATLQLFLENIVDHMPSKSKTLESGEKFVSICLPLSFCWSETLTEINVVNTQFGLPNVSTSGLSRIQKESFLEYLPKARVSIRNGMGSTVV